MNALETATQMVEALAAKDGDRLRETIDADALLEGPFPLGTKKGRDKVAKALTQVQKLGVKMAAPTETDGVVKSEIESPAGAMIVIFEGTNGLVTKLDVQKP
jgi:hypothetical protein